MPHLRAFSRFLTRTPAAADDLVQDTVTRALAARSQYTPGTSLKAWLFTIQRNIFYEQYRRNNKECEVLKQLSSTPPAHEEQSTPHTAQDTIRELDELLWQLPDILREALILVGAQELSYDEAGAICNTPAGTIKARVSRARSLLNDLKEKI
ncbi:sigma-70 family RNA polymerase sigma factor [Neokomagataea anthophila]|uniref:Sigma-70 family RNA polymerase sigma factor n=1 Tax=Neokomagataea anthophila TaxID=2826925 RepID=A0ABS5E6X6_9PROT|nr:sigma-70 family RNA polymerase sigma factor [Neokomagataea anthophila]MBR0559644.1 sigma-70 family RNA polymerase sigma factor [Neokomagataea anthophila]